MPKYTSLILETRHQLQMTVKFTPSHVTSGKESAGTSWIEVCVTCSANLDVLERINICNPCRESKQEWSVVQPVDKSPYRLGSPNQRSFMKLFCYDPARWLWMGWCAILCRTVSHTTQLDKLFCYAVWKWIEQEEAGQVVMLCCVETSHATGSRNPFDQVKQFLLFISEVWDSNMGTKVLCPGLDSSVFSRQLLGYFLSVGQRFSDFFQVGTTFISQNVLRATLLLGLSNSLGLP